MKPYQAFLFILFVSGILGAVYLLFPEPEGGTGMAEIPVIYETDTLAAEIRPIVPPIEITEGKKGQTLTEKNNVAGINQPEPKNKTKAESDTLTSFFGSTGILFPQDSAKIWAQLNEKLSKTASFSKPLRILYYGDSQIENDRITSVFRKKLQERFGGYGRGLVPVRSSYNSANNMVITTSKNWEPASVSGKNKDKQDFGLLCEIFSLKANPSAPDSVSSWIKVKTIDETNDEGYSVASIFYRSCGESKITVELNGEKNYTGNLNPSGQIDELRLDLGKTPSELELKFSTSGGLTLYGLTLESPRGVMVDNIALRGRSNPSFAKIDSAVFKQMAGFINPAFVILQYGVNVIPHITTNYGYYRNLIEKDILYLKKTLPGVPILLVGVSDMAHKVEGSLESYPNLKYLIKTQKETALANGCAFWNLCETMGGAGSMIDWVNRQPPLGNKDYVHYTPLGADKVGQLLAQEFIRVLESEQQTVMLPDEF